MESVSSRHEAVAVDPGPMMSLTKPGGHQWVTAGPRLLASAERAGRLANPPEDSLPGLSPCSSSSKAVGLGRKPQMRCGVTA